MCTGEVPTGRIRSVHECCGRAPIYPRDSWCLPRQWRCARQTKARATRVESSRVRVNCFVKLLDLYRLILEPKMTAHIPPNSQKLLQFAILDAHLYHPMCDHECYSLKELKNHATESERYLINTLSAQHSTDDDIWGNGHSSIEDEETKRRR